MYNAGKTVDVGDVWPGTRKDLSAVEWAHAVNSEAELKAALWGKSPIQLKQLDPCVQGDQSGWLQPPVDFIPTSCLGSRAVGSYSSGPPAAGAIRTKSTGGFFPSRWVTLYVPSHNKI